MEQQTSIAKSQNKLQSILPSNYRSLTAIRERGENVELNAESISPCTCKKICEVSITPEMLREEIVEHLSHEPTLASLELLACLKEWTADKWKDHRMKIANRINKLKYLHPSLIEESYTVIQKQIMLEWKKNPFLHGFQLLWNHVFRTHKSFDLKDLQNFYQTIRTLVARISFLLFQPCFRALQKKKFAWQHRLSNMTAVSILTNSKEWSQIAQKVIKPCLLPNLVNFSEDYNMEDLKAPPEIIDLSSKEHLFKKTAESLEELQQSSSLLGIIDGLKSYRANMVEEIHQNIERWTASNGMIKSMVLQKEDILACIIYTLVTGKLDTIGVTLKYIKFLLGNEVDSILGKYQVDCFRVDLEVAYEYLTQPVVRISFEAPQQSQLITA